LELGNNNEVNDLSTIDCLPPLGLKSVSSVKYLFV